MPPFLRWVAALALLGCSSQGPDPSVATNTEPDPSPPPTHEPTVEPAQTSEPSDPPPQGSSTGGGAQPREIMRKDCAALAQKYGELVRTDEASKLNPKLSAAQMDTAKANIDKAAQTLADRFREGCEQSLVGKFAEESALQCAMTAKRLADFDVCMNGPATPPAK